MFLLKHYKIATPVISFKKHLMTKTNTLVNLSVDNEGIAEVTMQSPPINILTVDLMQQLIQCLNETEKIKPKGIILTSASPTVFSAGLDVKQMFAPDIKKVQAVSSTLHELWYKLFGSKYITTAAINGHAPAGGCFLAISCEYRAMVNGYKIGLNETEIGILPSLCFRETMCYAISVREAEYALTSARMFSVDEAVKLGLVSEKADSKTDAIEKCKQFIRQFDTIPPYARGITKQRLREDILKKVKLNEKQDNEETLAIILDPVVQEKIGNYIEGLKTKKKEKNVNIAL